MLQREPWVMFEAGAVSNALPDNAVCPYLVGMKPVDLVEGPLTQFQAKVADRESTLEMVRGRRDRPARIAD